jgi:hypothetical protein
MSENDKGYLGALAGAAPLFAAKSLIGDLPKGAIEYAVENKIRTPSMRSLDLLRRGASGRGVGRAAGGAAGVLTAPLYLKSIKLLGSDNKADRRKGVAYSLGSTAIYAGLKGGLEGGIEAKAHGASAAKALMHGALGSLSRVPVKLLPAAVTTAAIAKSMGAKSDGTRKSLFDQYAKPMLVGAGTATSARLAERSIRSLVTTRKLPSARAMAAIAAGSAVGGALGGGVLTAVTKRLLRKEGAKKEEPKKEERWLPTMKPWFKPYPHQANAIARAYSNHGRMILAHDTGTGKTATGVALIEKMVHDGKSRGALIVVPSGLRHNFAEDGIDKFTDGVGYQIVGSQAEARKSPSTVRLGGERHVAQGGPRYTVVSYSLFRRDPVGLMRRTGADTLLFDEFHRVRNESAQIFGAAMQARGLAKNFIGMTASPINNHPKELATLLTISEGVRVLSPKQFQRAFMKTVGHEKGFHGGKKKVQGVKNEEQLVQMIHPKMDVVGTDLLPGNSMPKRVVDRIEVPMSEEQYKLYKLALDEHGALEEYLIRRDPNVSVKNAEQLFAQLHEARKISNSLQTGRKDISLAQSATRTPKVNKLLGDAEEILGADPKNKVVLYSNLVRGGVDVLSAGLTARGIEHGVFTGKGTQLGDQKITGSSRQQAVRDYKAGKTRAIILSAAGAEGLDLKDSSAFLELDSHFNPERIHQAEARAVRLGGQSFRKPEDRKVNIRRYVNTPPESAQPGMIRKMMGAQTPMTTDEWMWSVAKRKGDKTDKVMEVLKQPHKYIRKFRSASGEWRYVYPDDKSGNRGGSVTLNAPRRSLPATAGASSSAKPSWWKFWRRPWRTPQAASPELPHN